MTADDILRQNAESILLAAVAALCPQYITKELAAEVSDAVEAHKVTETLMIYLNHHGVGKRLEEEIERRASQKCDERRSQDPV